MHFFSRFSLFSAVITAACILFLSSCTAGSGLFAYTAGAAEYTLVFPSVSGDTDTVRASCIRDETGNTTLTVISPPRLSGFTVTCTEGTVSAGMDDMKIPLSPDTAHGLTAVFTALSAQGSPTKSPDGAFTVIDTGNGTVTLDETLTPVAVDVGEVSVQVEGFRLMHNS